MKLAHCMRCGDFVAPYWDWRTTRAWRWCECRSTGTRWTDGFRGLLQVTSTFGKADVRIIGLNNMFLELATSRLIYGNRAEQDEEWRLLHDEVAEKTGPEYLFSERHRQCWAIVIRPGETSDVEFVDYTTVIPAATVTP